MDFSACDSVNTDHSRAGQIQPEDVFVADWKNATAQTAVQLPRACSRKGFGGLLNIVNAVKGFELDQRPVGLCGKNCCCPILQSSTGIHQVAECMN